MRAFKTGNRAYSLLLVLNTLIFISTTSAQNTWIQKADLGGMIRREAVGFSIGAKGYIGTGWEGTLPAKKDFWEWNQATNVWTQKADFGGTARYYAVGFSIGLKGYIGTGFDGAYKKDFWEYDPSTNFWTQKADFGGTARLFAVGFSIDGMGYIGTGKSSTVTNNQDFWEYNPVSDSWAQKANFGGVARQRAVGFSLNSKGFIGLGYDGTNSAGHLYNDFWEYVPTSNSWIQKANFGGSARFAAASFSINSKGYVGTGNDANYTQDFWEYNDSTNTWIQRANFGGTSRVYAVGISVGNKGYIGVGNDGSNLKDFWEWTPSCASQSAPITNNNGPVCSDSMLTLTASSISGATYNWTGPNGFTSSVQNPTVSNSATVAMSGLYSVSAFVNGCPTDTGTTNVIVNPLPSTPVIDGDTIIISGQTTLLSVTNPCSGCTYTWSNGMTGQSINVNSAGSYSAIAANFCGTSTFSNILSVEVSPFHSLRNLPIAAGGFHSLSLCSSGSVRGWGKNQYGQLGDGATNYTDDIPDSVIGLNNIIALYAGERHSLAIKSDSTVWAWGGNQAGQLGDSTSTQRNTPVNVHGLQKIISIDGGYSHSLAIKNDGTAWAWGSNYWGQLGDSTIMNRIVPVQVHNLTGIVAIAGGNGHSLALKNDSTVWAWGENNQGQLGDSSNIDKHYPVQVIGLSGIIAIAAGYEHSLALKNDGTVWAWGHNSYGQLGDSSNTARIVPVQVKNLNGITAIAGGGYFSLALKNDSTVWGWGNNGSGELGDGTFASRNVPVQMNLLTGITYISAGDGHSLVLKSDSTVWACGYNYFGQLGDGTNLFFDSPVPGQVNGLCKVAVPCNISQPTITNFGNTTFCQGDSVILTASPANTFLWTSSDTTQSINVFSSGNYSVTISDGNGCSATSLPITVIANVAQNGLTILSSNDTLTSPYAQQNNWYLIGNSSPIDTGNIHVCLQSGDYFVTGLDANGCSATSDTLFSNCIGTGVSSISTLANIQVFPNPTHESSTVLYSIINEAQVSINLFDITGDLVQKVLDRKLQSGNNSSHIETSQLSNGIYFLEIKIGYETLNLKLVVAK